MHLKAYAVSHWIPGGKGIRLKSFHLDDLNLTFTEALAVSRALRKAGATRKADLIETALEVSRCAPGEFLITSQSMAHNPAHKKAARKVRAYNKEMKRRAEERAERRAEAAGV